MMGLSLRLAWRELRGGVRGFAIFLACLALGVGAIAAAGSLDAALKRTLAEDSRALLGGDAEIRLTYRPPTAVEMSVLNGFGATARTLEMRAMAYGAGDGRSLVEIKSVDGAYPLYGDLVLSPAIGLAAVLEKGPDGWGVAVDANLLDRLGLKLGQSLRLGAATLTVRAVIEKEPDRVANAFSFGPRLLIGEDALAETGLVQPGSLIRHSVLVRFRSGIDQASFKAALEERFPHAEWRVRDSGGAAPGLKRFLDSMTQFLTLVGLSALLVGGIGVAGGVKAFLDGRTASIATLKCLGASRRLILAVYFWEVMALAAVGILIGLLFGAALPALAAAFWGDVLPLEVRIGLYPQPLALAAAFGILTVLAFSAWPLAQAGRVSPTLLFRDIAQPVRVWPGAGAMAVIAAAGAGLAALAIISAPDRRLAIFFVLGALAAFLLFTLAGEGLVRLARAWARRPRRRGRSVALALALSSLSRPGAPSRGVVLSLGLGLTVLVAIALVQANLSRQFDETMLAEAPSFFFIDIQPDQVGSFTGAVAASGGRIDGIAPMVRGRIAAVNGEPVERLRIASEAEWAVRGDRGLTMAATPPDGVRLVAGDWWPERYDGPPLVSLDAEIAKGLGLGLGQTVTVNVLGREITATVASLREIDWASLSMNFTFIFSPGTLDGAPRTFIATVHTPDGADGAVERAVTGAVPTLSSIRVKEALEAARGVIANAALAIAAAAAVTLAAGVLVLAGAALAVRERRMREAVLMKVLGARRADLMRALVLEYALLGAATGVLAALLGSVAAYGVLVHVLRAGWLFLPVPLAASVAAAVLAVALVGVLGTGRVLAGKAAPHLRHA